MSLVALLAAGVGCSAGDDDAPSSAPRPSQSIPGGESNSPEDQADRPSAFPDQVGQPDPASLGPSNPGTTPNAGDTPSTIAKPADDPPRESAPGSDSDTAAAGTTDEASGPSPDAMQQSANTTDDVAPDADEGDDSATSAPEEPVVPPTLPPSDELGPYEVLVEKNVGVGYENPINSNDEPDAAFCTLFASAFGQDAEETADFVEIPADLDMALHTLYRPAKLVSGVKYPLLAWGNGTCALPEGYHSLLEHVASHGFLVIAPHSRWVGSGEPQRNGIDWVLEENERADSPLYGMVDPDRIGAFGHSQGGMATGIVGGDARVRTTVLLNGGDTAGLEGPTFVLTGEDDLDPRGARSAYEGARVPAAFIELEDSDHITLITEPPRVYGLVAAWFRYQLLDDEEGRSWFAGPDCKLCAAGSAWDFEASDLD